MSNVNERALELHKNNQGKLAVQSKVPLHSAEDLTLAYTPGVAAPCLAIKDDPRKAYDYTSKGNMVAVVTNGTAVLGLGNIGAMAGLPVMEGKAVLFKAFAGVDAVPICLDAQDPIQVIKAVQFMAPTFGGINLEDIKAPQCFDIERELNPTNKWGQNKKKSNIYWRVWSDRDNNAVYIDADKTTIAKRKLNFSEPVIIAFIKRIIIYMEYLMATVTMAI